MLNLEKLLICDGRPTQELINYQVDTVIQKMLNVYLSSEYESTTRANHEKLLDVEKTLDTYDNSLLVWTKYAYLDETLDKVKQSIQRYEPFVKISRRCQHAEVSKEDNQLVPLSFHTRISATPQMKQAMLLNQEMEQKVDSSKNSRPKI